jgi:hypothetical protein
MGGELLECESTAGMETVLRTIGKGDVNCMEGVRNANVGGVCVGSFHL